MNLPQRGEENIRDERKIPAQIVTERSFSFERENDRPIRAGRRYFHKYYEQVQEERQEDKVHIPSLSGNSDLETFLDWIKNVENFFDYMNTPVNKR